ncbi:uncharacterized protein LTHEOB_8681 [Lasiodiplodia theobromae]|uniref:uncharacterized protein n=1 Tax=Lasiodiplodia theobromae TaxID=45133 RepID=UPI0015C3373F|nr:uncharacterized protein LTHEOB_8681 [Lasiodiplodia theobromae]KAF4541285.1 hypothetical protein LTHEOB_8681 [Lasiodiplodia theobromae]
MATNISIGLRKFSFTDTPEKPFQWEHEMSPGLTFTFAPPHLKITIGKKVLDSVDVHQKVQQTKTQLAAMEMHGAALRNDDLPISAMSRPNQPALGIMYRKSSRRIRRMQLTFNSASDAKIAYDLIVRSGVKMFTKYRPSSATLDFPPSQSATMGASDYPSSPPGMRRLVLQNSSHDREDVRPSTAPATELGSGLMDMLPPRRELPFSRPDSRDSGNFGSSGSGLMGSQISNSRPSSSNRPSTANLPPLKPPTYASRSTTAKHKTQLTTEMPSIFASQSSSSHYFSANPAPSSDTIGWESSKTLRPGSSASKQSLIDIVGSNELSHSHRQPFSSSKETAAHETGQLSRGYDEDLTDLVRNATQSDASKRLQSYAAQPWNAREDLLSEFFVSCIEDDAFITLCQDVNANWRRIGLGLQ